MKKLILYLVLVAAMFSCKLAFKRPQPATIVKEETFPKILQGTWDNDGDRIIITESTFDYWGGLFDWKGSLSDSVVLKYFNGNYFLSAKEHGKSYWYVLLFSLRNDNRLQICPLNMETDEAEKLAQIKDVSEIYKEDGELDYYLLDPTLKEFESLLEILEMDCDTLFSRQQE